MNNHKTALTPQERIKCAYLHYIRGIAQQDLATCFETNMGRVNEACKAIWEAALDPKGNRTFGIPLEDLLPLNPQGVLPMDTSYVAKRDFSAGGKQYKQGEAVTGLAQSEVAKRVQAGEIQEQPAPEEAPPPAE